MTISEPSLHAEPCTQTALWLAEGGLARLARLERVQPAAQGRAVAARREWARQRDRVAGWTRPAGGGGGGASRLLIGLGLLHQARAVRVVARASLATRAALLRPAAAAAAAAAAKAHQREARRRLGARGWRAAEVTTVRARGER